jgi:hypothetical protein
MENRSKEQKGRKDPRKKDAQLLPLPKETIRQKENKNPKRNLGKNRRLRRKTVPRIARRSNDVGRQPHEEILRLHTRPLETCANECQDSHRKHAHVVLLHSADKFVKPQPANKHKSPPQLALPPRPWTELLPKASIYELWPETMPSSIHKRHLQQSNLRR